MEEEAAPLAAAAAAGFKQKLRLSDVGRAVAAATAEIQDGIRESQPVRQSKDGDGEEEKEKSKRRT